MRRKSRKRRRNEDENDCTFLVLVEFPNKQMKGKAMEERKPKA